jgi:CRP/FNR family transcriptional regulator, cyclic AMP receptor protein
MKKLNLIDKAFLLKRTPLFSTLDLDLLLAIADKLGIANHEAGETVFSYNQDANRMYFIAQGDVRILDKDKKPLAVLREDDFFGDESLFYEKPRGYQAICESDTMLLTLSRTNLFSIISECPSVAMGLLQLYASLNPFRPRKMLGSEP